MLGARVWASFGKHLHDFEKRKSVSIALLSRVLKLHRLQGCETISVNPGRGNIKMNSRGTTGEPVVALMPISTTGYVLCSLTSLL